jgi:sugar/nucleoside kinase (ribokinase family)
VKAKLRPDPLTGFTQVLGVGGIGTGTIIALHENHTLGRNESRMGEWIDARDYCKLHIVEHYIAVLFDAKANFENFKVFAVGNIGDDTAGATLISEMAKVGIDTRYVRIEAERPTLFSFAFFYPDKSGGNITASNSAACQLSSVQLTQCRKEMQRAGRRGIALCLPEVPLDARSDFLRIATECENYRIASFTAEEMEKVRQMKLPAHVDLLAVNHEEAIAFTGEDTDARNEQQLLEAVFETVNELNPAMKMIVSGGPAGAHVLENGIWSHHRTIPMKTVSTAGAGDAMLAGIIAGLAAGLPLVDASTGARNCCAIDLGLVLAAFSVTSPHTIHPGASRERFLAIAAENGIQMT